MEYNKVKKSIKDINNAKIILDIDIETKTSLEEIAHDLGGPLSMLLRMVLKDYVKKNKPK